jgi:uncharacterized membrane protein
MTEPPLPPQGLSAEGPAQDPALFSAVLAPHRSLGPKGFIVLMCAISAVSFSTGLLFYLLGAWPVPGFMGLDVLLVYIAFKLNFRALRVYETVDLDPEALTVTRVAPNGHSQSWSFNPYWVRLSLNERVGRTSELSLASHGKRLVFGSFLTDPEREDFAAALASALRDARSASPA